MTLLSVERVSAGYGGIVALKSISISVAARETVAIVGANGAGKTTLLSAISGLIRIRRGGIRLDDRRIDTLRPAQRVNQGIVHVPEGRQTFGRLTVHENLAMGGYTVGRKEVHTRLEDTYTSFPVLAERRTQLAGTLSGGEQQMLALARGLMSRPRLLLLDEPSMGLAPIAVEQIFKVLSELKGRLSMLIVEQNAQAVLQIADRGYVMELGTVVDSGLSGVVSKDAVRTSYLGGLAREGRSRSGERE